MSVAGPVTEPLPRSGAGSSRNRLQRYPSRSRPARTSHPRITPSSRKPAFSNDFCSARYSGWVAAWIRCTGVCSNRYAVSIACARHPIPRPRYSGSSAIPISQYFVRPSNDPDRQLQTLSAQEPLRDRLIALLMTALYRCGRQADALSTYDGFARRLVDEFGLDPSDELRALRQSILTSALDGEWQHQNQLPLDIRNLVGRDDLITEVVDLLTATEGVRIVALSGTPGVGKTAVAVRVARELTERFPDGQWFVRLRGASDQPRHADDVLVELLRASGVDSHAIPDDGDARAALFRSRLATRSILLVLDDAQGRGQVRPLLPGTPTSAVLVTSRNPLDALAALDGGIPIRVPTLTPKQARPSSTRCFRQPMTSGNWSICAPVSRSHCASPAPSPHAARSRPSSRACVVNRAGAYKELGELELAAADLRRAEPLVDNRLDGIQRGLAKAGVENRLGRHGDARRIATDVLRDSREIDNSYDTCIALQALAESHLHTGDLATARTYFEEGEALAANSGYATVLAELHCDLSLCNFLDGEIELAHAQATQALADSAEYGIGRQLAHDLLARCCRALGRPDERRRPTRPPPTHSAGRPATSRAEVYRPRSRRNSGLYAWTTTYRWSGTSMPAFFASSLAASCGPTGTLGSVQSCSAGFQRVIVYVASRWSSATRSLAVRSASWASSSVCVYISIRFPSRVTVT